MTQQHRESGASRVFVWVATALVVVLVIGAVAFFTNGFTSDFSTFYVEMDGETVMEQKGGFSISSKTPSTINVKYTFGDFSDEASGYSVKVIPHAVEGEDFDIVIDGIPYSFHEEEDFTDGFIIETSEDSFTIQAKGNLNDVMEAVYEGATRGDCLSYAYDDMFTLVITSYNGKEEVMIHFCLRESVSSFTLSESELIFR